MAKNGFRIFDTDTHVGPTADAPPITFSIWYAAFAGSR